jgi:hypothetical protein
VRQLGFFVVSKWSYQYPKYLAGFALFPGTLEGDAVLIETGPQIVPLLERLTNLGLIRTHWAGTAVLHLYKAPTTPIGPDVLLGDLVECDYDGYASLSPCAMSVAFLAPSGDAVTLSATDTFPCTGNTTPNLVYGAYLTNVGVTELIAVFPFLVPVGVGNAGDAVPVAVQLHYSGT